MKHSWLIQRLKKPLTKEGSVNPFSFGGGLKNGGFQDGAMDILKKIMDFDYMGAAEFEFGAVPKAFEVMLDNSKKYITKEIEVDYSFEAWGSGDVKTGTSTVWVICKEEDLKEASERIRHYAKNTWAGPKYDTKELVMLNSALGSEEEKVCGWVDIKNPYMFFSDKEMFNNVKKLMGIK